MTDWIYNITLSQLQPTTKEQSVLMSDFLFLITFIVMLSILEQVGASLELMGKVRLLTLDWFFASFIIVM
jgi:hypothetical protein